MRRRVLPAFWLGFLATFLVRAVVALSRLDEIELERYSGTLAAALLEGMPLDPARLPIIGHIRGSVAFGVLAVPVFALLGPSLLALKLLAVGWAALTGGLLAWTIERAIGRGAAVAGAAVFALAPPSIQMVSVLALGSHEAVALFQLASLGYLLCRLPGPAAAPRALGARAAAILGLVCGLGLTFSFHHAVVLPALALAWWARDARFPLRAASYAFLPALALGAAPILLLSPDPTMIQAASAGDQILPEGAAAALAKLASLPAELPRSWLFETHGGRVPTWLLAAALAFALPFAVARALRRDALAAFALAYPALWTAFYAVSSFRFDFDNTWDGIGSRYAIPLWPSFAIWIAIAGESLVRRRRAYALLVLAPALAAGAAGVLSMADPLVAWRQPRMRGIDATGFSTHLLHAGGDDALARIGWIERLDRDWGPIRPLAHADALPTAFDRTRPREVRDAAVTADRAQPELRPYLLAAHGYQLLKQDWNDAPEAAVQRFLVLAPALESWISAEGYAWWLRGAGRALFESAAWAQRLGRSQGLPFAAALAALPPEARAHVMEGAGFVAGARASPYEIVYRRILARAVAVPPELRAPFYRAAGIGFRTRFFERDYFVPAPGALRVERELPEEVRAWFREGLDSPRDRFDTGASDAAAE